MADTGDILPEEGFEELAATGCYISVPTSVPKGSMFRIDVMAQGGSFVNFTAKVSVNWPFGIGNKYKAKFIKKNPTTVVGIGIEPYTPNWGAIESGGTIKIKAVVKESGSRHKCSGTTIIQ
jgi:hypothetical protein